MLHIMPIKRIFRIKIKQRLSINSSHLFKTLPFAFSMLTCNAYAFVQTNVEQVEVISVTASKTPQQISQSPDSISAILASEIAIIAPQHINQVLDGVPGTWISRGNGQEHLTAIRSPVLTGAGSCGAFFMGLDGISIRAPGFCNANQLFDINYEQAASVDVLRSPASTLYGGNALHGVINIISQNAFNHQQNSLGINAGANDFLRISSQHGTASEDSAWLSLVNLTQENGYQKQSGYDQQKVTFVYQQNGDIWSNKTVVDMSNLNQETAGFIRGENSFKDDSIRRSNPNPEAFRDVKSLRLYSAFTRNIQDAQLTLTPYMRYNEMAFLQHFLPWQALEKNEHQSLGLQSKYQFTWQNISWITGADIDLTSGDLSETQENDFSPSIPQGVHYDYDVDAYQLAAYAQGVYEHDKWVVRFGARVERNSYDYDNLTQSDRACSDEVAVCRFVRPDDQSRSFTAVSPSINVQYLMNDTTSIYTKFSQGFRAPQATELFRLQNDQQIADIDNENMNAIELGLRLANQTSSLHAAAFYMKKDDVIFQNSDRQNVSGGKTKHQGIELAFRHAFDEQWQINGHLSFAQHTYANDTSLVNSNINGNEIDTAPQWLSNVNINYSPSEALQAQLSWQYISEYELNPQNTAQYDGHQLLDLNLRYQLNESVNLALHVLNLGDVAYAERADFAFGSYRYFVGQPRRAFINLVWSY